MNKHFMLAASALAFTTSAIAQDSEPVAALSPNQIVEQASAEEWIAIPEEDLLVMTLAPDAQGNPREVIIQLMSAPFSQGWVENIRKFARAKWYDGISVNRVQDNYVVQWGDPNYDNPEAAGETKPLPEGLKVLTEEDYTISKRAAFAQAMLRKAKRGFAAMAEDAKAALQSKRFERRNATTRIDPYSADAFFQFGWPTAADGESLQARMWPVHCYGMVGVGRGYSPDAGSGAELYTVIGHAPRHLDRNIAVVGRIVEGMQYLSSLPRGSGALGFYTEEEFAKRTPILTVRVASDLPANEQPQFEFLDTESETFTKYAEARANRRDPFFIMPAGGADICNIPVPIRPAPNG